MVNRPSIVQSLRDAGIVAVVRTPSADEAVKVVEALAAGGVMAAEVTFTVPDAAKAIAAVRDKVKAGDLPPDVLLGAGTVITADQAEAAVDAGATYLVSPHLCAGVMHVAARRDVAALPGALTPAEVFAAHESGGDIIKVFPATRMGPSYLKDLRGPYPNISLMPTGGVSVSNLHEWLDAGAVAVGVGSELVDKQAVARGDFAEITSRAAVFVEALAKLRGNHA